MASPDIHTPAAEPFRPVVCSRTVGTGGPMESICLLRPGAGADPRSAIVAAALKYRKIELYRATDPPSRLLTLDRHTSLISRVAPFYTSLETAYPSLLSASSDRTVRLWTLSSMPGSPEKEEGEGDEDPYEDEYYDPLEHLVGADLGPRAEPEPAPVPKEGEAQPAPQPEPEPEEDPDSIVTVQAFGENQFAIDVCQVSSSPGRFVVAGFDRISLWDVTKATRIGHLPALASHVVCSLANGSVIFNAREAWDLRSFRLCGEVNDPLLFHAADEPTAISVLDDDAGIAVGYGGSGSNDVVIRDLRTFDRIATLAGHRRGVYGLAEVPRAASRKLLGDASKHLLLSSSCDMTVRVWDITTGIQSETPTTPEVSSSDDAKPISPELLCLDGHGKYVKSVSWIGSDESYGGMFCSGGVEKRLRFWRPAKSDDEVKMWEEIKEAKGLKKRKKKGVRTPRPDLVFLD